MCALGEIPREGCPNCHTDVLIKLQTAAKKRKKKAQNLFKTEKWEKSQH